MAGTKRYKVTPTHQRVIWKAQPTSRGMKYKQVAIEGTSSNTAPSTPSHCNDAISPGPDIQYDNTPLALPVNKVSNFIDFWQHHSYLKKTQNDYLRLFKDKRNLYLSRMLSNEAPPEGHQCSSCKMREIAWRCLDCIGHNSKCTQCFRDHHRFLPFHRLEHWAGTYFEPA